jgi:hypothetical protein
MLQVEPVALPSSHVYIFSIVNIYSLWQHVLLSNQPSHTFIMSASGSASCFDQPYDYRQVDAPCVIRAR